MDEKLMIQLERAIVKLRNGMAAGDWKVAGDALAILFDIKNEVLYPGEVKF